MSNLPLQYSEFKTGKIIKKKERKNRTYKKKEKVTAFLESMENDDGDDKLENFEPNQTQQMHNPPIPPPVPGQVARSTGEDAAVDNPAQLSSNLDPETYYKQYVPYYTNVANEKDLHRNKDRLIEKLNYMIHLLEEQQNEKTATVTEELILYLFLGVFVIFTVDSFARAGKYTR